MSWYWLDHTLIPQRTIYLFLTKQLPLIDDVISLINNNVKQLLSPWSKSDNDTEIDNQYDRWKWITSLAQHHNLVYPCQFLKNGNFMFMDFHNMTMSPSRSDMTYRVMRTNNH